MCPLHGKPYSAICNCHLILPASTQAQDVEIPPPLEYDEGMPTLIGNRIRGLLDSMEAPLNTPQWFYARLLANRKVWASDIRRANRASVIEGIRLWAQATADYPITPKQVPVLEVMLSEPDTGTGQVIDTLITSGKWTTLISIATKLVSPSFSIKAIQKIQERGCTDNPRFSQISRMAMFQLVNGLESLISEELRYSYGTSYSSSQAIASVVEKGEFRLHLRDLDYLIEILTQNQALDPQLTRIMERLNRKFDLVGASGVLDHSEVAHKLRAALIRKKLHNQVNESSPGKLEEISHSRPLPRM